jgi:hypothetical protein
VNEQPYYIVVQANTRDGLTELVNAAKLRGYEPQGGFSFERGTPSGIDPIYSQAMILNDKLEK